MFQETRSKAANILRSGSENCHQVTSAICSWSEKSQICPRLKQIVEGDVPWTKWQRICNRLWFTMEHKKELGKIEGEWEGKCLHMGSDRVGIDQAPLCHTPFIHSSFIQSVTRSADRMLLCILYGSGSMQHFRKWIKDNLWRNPQFSASLVAWSVQEQNYFFCVAKLM